MSSGSPRKGAKPPRPISTNTDETSSGELTTSTDSDDDSLAASTPPESPVPAQDSQSRATRPGRSAEQSAISQSAPSREGHSKGNTGVPSRQQHATVRPTRAPNLPSGSRAPTASAPPSQPRSPSPPPPALPQQKPQLPPRGTAPVRSSGNAFDASDTAVETPDVSPIEGNHLRDDTIRNGAQRAPNISGGTKRESKQAMVENVKDDDSSDEGMLTSDGGTDDEITPPQPVSRRGDQSGGSGRAQTPQKGAPSGGGNTNRDPSRPSDTRGPLAPPPKPTTTTTSNRTNPNTRTNTTRPNATPPRTSPNRQPGLCDTISSCCTASCSACSWCGQWTGWRWIRAHLAYLVALLLGVLLVVIGVGTGPTLKEYGWWFCTVGDVSLGGSGYCEGSNCEMAFVYTVPSIKGPIYESTQILSALLLILPLGGLLSLLSFMYLLFQYTCRQTCPQPHRQICYCCFSLEDPLPPPPDQAVIRDNQMSSKTWDSLTQDERLRLQAEFRCKEWLDWVVNVLRLWGLFWGGAAWIWVEVVDGEDNLGLQALWAWFALAILVWPVTRVMYRGSPRRVRRMAREGIRTAQVLGDRAVDSVRRGADAVSRNTRNPTTRGTGTGVGNAQRGQTSSRPPGNRRR